jgi:hypothetical protein
MLRHRRVVAVTLIAASAALTFAFAALASGSYKDVTGTNPAPGAGTCGLPTTTPLWIDYGESNVRPDTRAVLSRPGVVVASSGTAVPAQFRSQGVATVYFQRDFPDIVGTSTNPNDASTVIPATDALFSRAVTSTACPTPWIALNELEGSNLRPPWSARNAAYRANVLTVMQRLAERGAYPALLIHGDPYVGGDASTWWRAAATAGSLVYEAYYNAVNINALGTGLGNRRMRLGMRNLVDSFKEAGIPTARVGFMLGFHSAQTPGIGGRQGLQPREAWLRVVKWEALAARQVAIDEDVPTIWSWGWGTFGPESVDEDKSAAACAWLWARDIALCDAPSVGGPSFNTSRIEGQIVLPAGVACAFTNGRLSEAPIDRLAKFTHDEQTALSAQFERIVLSRMVSVGPAKVLAAERMAIERAFHGDRDAYLRALARRNATLEIARGVIGDELRRKALATFLAKDGSGTTAFEAVGTSASRRVATATCLRDELPGAGDFPASDARYVGPGTLAASLPFLFADRTAPAAPVAPSVAISGTTVTLTWTSGREADLAGYEVLRSAGGGAYELLTPEPLARLTFVDRTLTRGASAVYVVRAIDTSRNVSARSAPAGAAIPPQPTSPRSP